MKIFFRFWKKYIDKRPKKVYNDAIRKTNGGFYYGYQGNYEENCCSHRR